MSLPFDKLRVLNFAAPSVSKIGTEFGLLAAYMKDPFERGDFSFVI